MANVLVMKNEEGKLEGFGRRGERAYNRFLGDLRKLEVGEMLQFSYRVPRSGPFHNRHFRMLNDVFEAQEAFDDEYIFRKWLEIGAGHCEFAPGKDGELVPIPKSIDYESLDQADFEPIHYAVKAFMRSPRATGFLWPHLTAHQQWEMIEQLLAEFDR